MASLQPQPYYAIRTRRPAEGSSTSSVDSTYGSGVGDAMPTTHDTSRVSYHVKQIDTFAQTLQDSAARAFPNRGRSCQRYKNVQVLLLHWKTDDLFVLPELEDLEACFREDYGFNTDVFAIPSDNPHLELMMRIGSLVKDHESEDTLFVIYYGGHAKIDESRQSTWCATRHSGSPSLQWSAIQTLVERSSSDVLILLDCCAGAASATFPNGKSITETISASSWDAIAPDPGRYSFTNALIEVLGEWRMKTFSAAMLHAEVLARLKHPRPILINGKRFEARSTPVHFMMTSDHKAPSIEMSRLVPEDRRPPSPPRDQSPQGPSTGRGPTQGESLGESFTEPNEDRPHVMISLALEEDQRLDLNAWEQWLSSFPALARYVKVQGVFKSHSTLLLLSMPVTVWDLLPDDQACSFVAFIRSNNLINQNAEHVEPQQATTAAPEAFVSDRASVFSGTTFRDSIMDPSILASPQRIRSSVSDNRSGLSRSHSSTAAVSYERTPTANQSSSQERITRQGSLQGSSSSSQHSARQSHSAAMASLRTGPFSGALGLSTGLSMTGTGLEGDIVRQPLINQSRSSKRTIFSSEEGIPERPRLASHIIERLQTYYEKDPHPSDGTTEYYASHLGIEASDVKVWFHHRRQEDQARQDEERLRMHEAVPEVQEEPQMISGAHLADLLDIFTPAQLLFIDLRSPSEFQRSHIHSAVNLRMPPKFLRTASLEILDRTFPDEQSRRAFSRWSKAKCVVLYDRMIEAPWECPTAQELLDMLRRERWTGRCFILKGPFREFCLSHDRYVTGDRMTKDAKRYADGLRSATPPTEEILRRTHARYEAWLRRVQFESHGTFSGANNVRPRELAIKRAAVDDHLRELEVEFGGRFPELYKRMKELDSQQQQKQKQKQPPAVPPKDDSYFDTRKAHLVGSLSSGLDKMREAAAGAGSSPTAGYSFPNERLQPDKLGELPSPEFDDFDEIDPREVQQSPSGSGGRSVAPSGGGSEGSGAGSSALDYAARRVARETQHNKQGLWKRLRSKDGK